jgi:xanthine dehydrogenase YagR molybdenum-binding subunit
MDNLDFAVRETHPPQGEPDRIGTPAVRIDGRLKVTGAARYPSDEPVQAPAYAFLLTSTIAKGRIVAFHLDAAKAVPGFLDILTYQTVGDKAKRSEPPGGTGGKTTPSMQSDKVTHDGQIIGVILADTYEAAREAAQKVVVDYDEETPSAGFDSKGTDIEGLNIFNDGHEDPKTGDADRAFDQAAVKIEADYSTPTQHHNPLELFTTTCFWTDGKLTILEPSQFVYGLRRGVAEQLGIDPKKVRVVSKFIGGAFGSKGGPTARTAWIALAAQRLNRPVKLEATRDQGFTIATYRAETRHHIKLAAAPDGKLQALVHEGLELTSRPSFYNVSGTTTTSVLYACPNIRTKVRVAHADRNTPGFMRAPPETPYMFPLESAMDELAVALKMDPIELRRVNDTDKDSIKQRPYTSRSLMKCFDQAAAKFGWAQRNPEPASMRDGDWLIGYGCATACYPVNIGPAACRIRLNAGGDATVAMSAQDIGTGAYTVIGLTAADRLGLPIENITVDIGDSDLPAAGLAAGSNGTATTCNAVATCCDALRLKLALAASADKTGPLSGVDPATITLAKGGLRAANGKSEPLSAAVDRLGGSVEIYTENIPDHLTAGDMKKVNSGKMAMARGESLKDQLRFSFGAQFVEVRVHSLTREIRVARAVGAFAAGTIMNPLTAYSQFMGGMIWGIGAALLEATEIDERTARYTNHNLGEYLMAVNADIPQIDVIMVPEEDHKVNPLGIKGIGEIGIVGMNAAVANAVFHATGKRVRDLPIRVDDLLEG